ncbi:hypothetical protein [uncultured Tenacibaculum sp.]|uniref:hypothetical protein n=1 Tax=uncultured Tenacibaculum sp. TaxID=174713 RepID=UPI0026257F43|nr:hypothetical protein [uncultured Tenacibaculum sp.]
MKKTKNSFVFSKTNFIHSLLLVCIFLVLSSCSSNTENANSSGGGSVTIKPTNIVHEGSIVLKNQQQLNAFAQKGYTSVNGTLTIGEFPKCDITSLEGLKSLTKINGCLIIIGTIDLNSLQGLNNITSTECISITDAKKLTNIDPLKNLKSIIDNDLTDGVWMSIISGNDNLIDIDGLSGIENYVGALQIFNNKALLNLDGLKNINSFNTFSVAIRQNESLNNLNGLSAVNSIDNVLEISDNENLKSLDGLNNLNSVKRFCHITGNSKLKNLCAIKGLANNGENFTLDIRSNGYNPTRQDLINGDCLQ